MNKDISVIDMIVVEEKSTFFLRGNKSRINGAERNLQGTQNAHEIIFTTDRAWRRCKWRSRVSTCLPLFSTPPPTPLRCWRLLRWGSGLAQWLLQTWITTVFCTRWATTQVRKITVKIILLGFDKKVPAVWWHSSSCDLLLKGNNNNPVRKLSYS